MTAKKPEPTAAKPECEPKSAVGGPEVLKQEATSPDSAADTGALAAANDLLEDKWLLRGLQTQLFDAISKGGQIDEEKQKYTCALVAGLNPRNHLEMMLVSHMVAVHVATLAAAGTLARASTFPHYDTAERVFNKLARTFVTQMDAFNRYRAGGEHKVNVQHVSVNDGGQAIVGHVTHAPMRDRVGENGVSGTASSDSSESRRGTREESSVTSARARDR
jgi:hypothetical protein